MLSKKANLFRFLFFCAISILVFAFFYGCAENRIQPPTAQKGRLDLTHWNFLTDGPVHLDGEWAVFWNQLRTPEEIAGDPQSDSRNFYQLPGTWNEIENKVPPSSGFGYATLVLEIRMPPQRPHLSLRIREILTAYSLYVNGRLVSTRGIVGNNRQASKPELKPDIVHLDAVRNKTTIVLQVSNFQHKKGGPWTPLQLGQTDSMQTAASVRLFINIFLVGSIFMIGLYHLSMFLLGGKYRSSMYFGIFCLLISARSLVTNERYLYVIFPDVSWLAQMRIEYLTFYLSVPVFTLFIQSVFPEEFLKKIQVVVVAVSLAFVFFVCITPVSVFSHTIPAFQTVTFLTAGYLFYVFIAAYRRQREGTIVNLAGFVILFITIVNDILHVNEMIQTVSLIPVGMFFFIFSQAFMLSLIYSKSFKKVELQKEELGETNQALSKEIRINKVLQDNLVQSHEKFQKSRLALILGLAKLAEYRDEDTGAHLRRMREFSILLAIGLSKTPKYKSYITREYIDDIYQSSILHDIGKVGIKDAILLKPGKLTPEEFEEIKQHPIIGGDAITAIESEFKSTSFLTLGKNIAYAHHEKWDGSGYPKGLKKDAIPLSARIVAVADVYDALTSERPYKKAFSHETAEKIILEGRGAHFDPDIVDLFLELTDEFRRVREQFPD